MWNKPIEMCDFPAKGFECIYRSSNIADIHAALNKWQSNANTFSLLTSQGAWSKRKWKSIGIGILGSYVTLWLSEGTDPYNYPIKKKLTSE
jgi:hypothetical protein